MTAFRAAPMLAGALLLAGACRPVRSVPAPVDSSVEASDARLRTLLGFPPASPLWRASVDSVGRILANSLPSDASEERRIEAIARWMGSADGVAPATFPDDTDLVPSLAWERRRGGCTSLAWIWLRLSGPMGLELQPVLLPGHVVLRTREGKFVEVLRGGILRSRAFYDSAFRLDKRPAYRLDAEYLPVLEASLLVHQGLLCWKRRDLVCARTRFEAASFLVPKLPEAVGNLGLVLETEGDLSGARDQLALALAGDSLNDRAKSRWDAIEGMAGGK